jgi:hypothetical protein
MIELFFSAVSYFLSGLRIHQAEKQGKQSKEKVTFHPVELCVVISNLIFKICTISHEFMTISVPSRNHRISHTYIRSGYKRRKAASSVTTTRSHPNPNDQLKKAKLREL